MAVRVIDLNVEREPVFVTGQPMITWLYKGTGALHKFRDAEDIDQFAFSRTILLRLLAGIPYAFSLEEGVETQVSKIKSDYREFYGLGNIIRPWVEEEKEPWELEQEAFLAIAREFSQIEKVQSIYVQKYREEVQIQILLSVTQYDNELMDTLLDIEYDIRKRYTEIVFEFFYPPAGISEKRDFIHPQAYCIYSR